MFFEDSRPDRRKRAPKPDPEVRKRSLAASPIPHAKPYLLLTFEELTQGPPRTLIMDTESYRNYWLVAFICAETRKVCFFEDYQGMAVLTQFLSFIMHRHKIVGFNSAPYDLPMILIAMQGVRCDTLKDISDQIIREGMRAFEVARNFGVRPLNINHIDLIEVAPIQASLKTYAGRLHCERMQDLPYDVDTILTPEQRANVRDYCINDLLNTLLLYNHLAPQIELREELGKLYGKELRSHSDAQLAETIIKSELEKLGVKIGKPTIRPGDTFKYQVPDFLEFKTPQFQRALEAVRNTEFLIGDGGSALCPPEIAALKPQLGRCTYRLGVGGLHSSEESVSYYATEETLIIDRDVASYYPNIILNQGLFPQHLGLAFLEVYRGIVQRRLKAKREGNKSADQGLKIAINGTFGKLGNLYSDLYSPDLLTQVTMTGQLGLLMLIEMIELVGIPIASANTDGIVILCPKDRYEDLMTVIITWEEKTGFVTEETRYKSIHSRDVNNYIAVKLPDEGKNSLECKTKGVYSERGSALNSVLSKNPESLICSEAVQAFVAYGTPITETIDACRDITKFVNVRSVQGGAEKDGVYLGKSIRWYYAKGETGCINYVLSGNKVPKSDGAKPLMNLPEQFPADLDRDYYVNEAVQILYDVGVYEKPKVGKLF